MIVLCLKSSFIRNLITSPDLTVFFYSSGSRCVNFLFLPVPFESPVDFLCFLLGDPPPPPRVYRHTDDPIRSRQTGQDTVPARSRPSMSLMRHYILRWQPSLASRQQTVSVHKGVCGQGLDNKVRSVFIAIMCVREEIFRRIYTLKKQFSSEVESLEDTEFGYNYILNEILMEKGRWWLLFLN